MMRFLVIGICLISGLDSIAQEFARVRESNIRYEVFSPSKATISYYQEVEVLEERGLDHSVLIEAVDEFSDIKKVSVTLFDDAGKKIDKFNENNGLRFAVSESYGVNDAKMFVLDPEWKIYPFTVVIEYEIELDGYLSLPSWAPLSDYNLSVQHATVEVVQHEAADVALYPIQGLGAPQETIVEGARVSKWAVEQLKPYPKLPYSKDVDEVSPTLLIVPRKFELDGKPGEMNSWVSFGDWYYDLNQGLGDLTVDTKAKLDKLIEESNSQTELVSQIYKFMQDRTRYISIQLGIGGLRSLPVDFVDTKGFGDCKALSTYMKAMLEYAGISSNYILANAGDDKYPVMDSITYDPFNHVLLATVIEGDTIWMECTDQMSPIDFSGTFTDDRYVLWIEPGKSSLVKTPSYSTEDNQEVRKVKVSLLEGLSASLDVEIQKQGMFYERVSYLKSKSDEDIRNYNHRRFNFKDYEVTSYEFNSEESQITLNEHLRIWVRGFYKNVRDRVIFRAGVLGDDIVIPTTDSITAFADIKRPWKELDEYQITMPENFYLGYVGDEITVESPCGNYSLQVSEENGQVIIRRQLTMKQGQYSGAEFLKFKEFMDQVRKADNTKIMLRNKT